MEGCLDACSVEGPLLWLRGAATGVDNSGTCSSSERCVLARVTAGGGAIYCQLVYAALNFNFTYKKRRGRGHKFRLSLGSSSPSSERWETPRLWTSSRSSLAAARRRCLISMSKKETLLVPGDAAIGRGGPTERFQEQSGISVGPQQVSHSEILTEFWQTVSSSQEAWIRCHLGTNAGLN